MALTPNHKIYSPDISDRAQARTQMATMASSVESALNAQTASVQQSLTQTAATLNADSQRQIDTRMATERRERLAAQAQVDAKLAEAEANAEKLADYVDEKSFKTLLAADFGLYSTGANYRGIKSMSTIEVPSKLDELGAPMTGDKRLLSFVMGAEQKPYMVGANYRGTPIGAGAGAGGPASASSPVDKWVHYGDSLTDWGSPEALAQKTGYLHVNAGHASDTSAQIAMRAGAFEYQVKLNGGQIPSSGTVALIAHSPRSLTTGDGMKYPVVIAGVSGYISQANTGSVETFTRDAPGTPVDAPGWQVVTMDGPTPTAKQTLGNKSGYSLIIGAGRNDLLQRQNGGNVESVIANIRKIIDANKANAKHVLIWDIPPWSFETVGTNSARYREEWNAAIASAFPEYFVSITDKLRTDAAFSAVGASKTRQDATDIANGLTPNTFRRDNAGHFNDLGNKAWAHFMYLEMQKRGLIRE